jgi:hypothetical protein
MLERLKDLYYESETALPWAWEAYPWDDPWPWEEQMGAEDSAPDPTWALILDQEMPF